MSKSNRKYFEVVHVASVKGLLPVLAITKVQLLPNAPPFIYVVNTLPEVLTILKEYQIEFEI